MPPKRLPPEVPQRRDRDSDNDDEEQQDQQQPQQQQAAAKNDYSWTKHFAHSVNNVDRCAICFALDPPVSFLVPMRNNNANWSRFAIHLSQTHATTAVNKDQKYQEVVFAKNKEKHEKESECLALVWQCRKGIPDSMFSDPDYLKMLESAIAARKVPALKWHAALKQKRNLLAEKIRASQAALVKGGYLVDIQFDIGTRAQNRFIAVIVRVQHASGYTTTINNVQRSYVLPQSPETARMDVFMYKMVCDKEAPFTMENLPDNGDQENENLVLGEAEDEERVANRFEEIEDNGDNNQESDGEEEDAEKDEHVNGQMTAKAVAKFLYEDVFTQLSTANRKPIILGMCSDNGSNFRPLKNLLQENHQMVISDARCFAHVVQKVGNTIFGHPSNKSPLNIASLNYVMFAAIEFRKHLRGTIHLDEPCLTRWNTFFRLVKQIYEKILFGYSAHNDETRDPPNHEIVQELPDFWPAKCRRKPNVNQAIELFKKFIDTLAPVNDVTDMAQADNSNLGMGVAGLSHIFVHFKGTAPRTPAEQIAVMKPFKERLVHKNGSHFMTDIVVLYIALLPWRFGGDGRLVFMAQAKKLFLRVDPLCSDRQLRNQNVAAIVADYDKFCENLNVIPNIPQPARTAENFEHQWRNTFFNQFPYLAAFALKLARSGISEAACERVFSKLKYIINPLRSRTAIKNVRDQLNINMIDGLASNKELKLKECRFFTSVIIADEFIECNQNLVKRCQHS